MGLARLFGICAALLFASSVSAANIIDLGPTDYRNLGTGTNSHTGAGLRSSTGQTVRIPPAGGNLSVTRNSLIPYGSIANGAKDFARINPASVAASAAITALFLGLDWVFDDELDSWMKEGHGVPIPVGGEFFHWHVTPNPLPVFSTPMEACHHGAGLREAISPGWTYQVNRIVYSGSSYGTCRGVASEAGGSTFNDFSITTVSRGGNGCPAGATYSPSERACLLPSGYIDLDESDWTELAGYLPSADPDQVGTASHDIMKRQGAPLPGIQGQTITGPSSITGSETTSTSTDPVTGDTIVTTTNTTTNISYGDTTITTTNTTTSTTYQNGQETSTTVTTETPGELPVSSGGGAAGEWPGFCDWASVVCDWFNWTQEDPGLEDPDLPVPIDEDFFEYKEVSFGVKSCPPDYEINLSPFMDRVVGVSFQPLCDFAAIIYFMVMAASYIIAAYISIGVARSA